MTTTADQGLLAHVFCRTGNRQERLNALQIIARRDAAALLDKIDADASGGISQQAYDAALHRAEQAEAMLRQQRQADRPQGDQPRPQRNGNGGGYRRRPKPIVELEEPAHCADCGAELHVGEPVRVYPGGRIYGTRCHGRRC